MNPTAAERVEHHFRTYYGVGLADVELSSVPGYWRMREPCDGRAGCRNPLHRTLGCEGPVRHTLTYFDEPRDARGRWASPYRTWRLLWAAQREGTCASAS